MVILLHIHLILVQVQVFINSLIQEIIGLQVLKIIQSLYLQRGQTYKFNVNASGHPIKTQTGTGTGNQYTKGVVNQGTQSGIVFTVLDAPTILSVFSTLGYEWTD